MQNNSWARLLAYVTGLVNQRLLLQMRILDRRESNPSLPRLWKAAARRRRALHTRRNRQAARAEVACLEKRRVTLSGITRHPTKTWITQMARNAVDEPAGAVRRCRYLFHDRDAKFCVAFQDVFASEGTHCLKLPPQRLLTISSPLLSPGHVTQ